MLYQFLRGAALGAPLPTHFDDMVAEASAGLSDSQIAAIEDAAMRDAPGAALDGRTLAEAFHELEIAR